MILKLKSLKTAEEVSKRIIWLGAFKHNSWAVADLNRNQI